MVIRILQWILAVQLAAAAGFWYAATRYWPAAGQIGAAALAVALLLLVRLLITANNFWLSWRQRSDTPAEHALDWRGRLRLFCGEFAATMLSTSWSMLRRQGALHLAAGGGPQVPVLLIHGYGANGGYWDRLRALLAQRGISHLAVDLEPLTAGIDDYAPLIEQAVQRLCAATGAPQVIVLAHSMGGLVARAYLRRYGAARIAHVITLGTPHHGTGLARLGVGRNARQMRRSAAWLDGLAASEQAALRALITSIWSHHDNIIAPQTSCRLAGARNLEFGGIGHVALGRHPRILACVLDEIARVSSERRTIDSAEIVR